MKFSFLGGIELSANNKNTSVISKVQQSIARYLEFHENDDFFEEYKAIFKESTEWESTFRNFKSYLDDFLEVIKNKEKMYQENKNKDLQKQVSGASLISLAMLENDWYLKMYSTDFKNTFLTSLWISTFSFVESNLWEFREKHTNIKIEHDQSIILNYIDDLRNAGFSISKNIKADLRAMIKVRNDFVHNLGLVTNSKNVKFKNYYMKINPKTNEIVLSEESLYYLMKCISVLFRGLYQSLYDNLYIKLKDERYEEK